MSRNFKDDIKRGAYSALPMILGFFPVAMAFGLLSKNIEISLRDTGLFSIIVFAGASQFMALDLIKAGVSFGGIILATFLLNLRHAVMSASLSTRLENVKRGFLPLIAFGVTDESFSVMSFTKDSLTVPFVLTLNTLAYLSWSAGTFTGYLVGEILPQTLQTSLGIGLYAMFAALLFPQFKGDRKVIFLSLLTAAVYLIIYYTKLLTSGWDIIVGIILSSILGVFIFDRVEGSAK